MRGKIRSTLLPLSRSSPSLLIFASFLRCSPLRLISQRSHRAFRFFKLQLRGLDQAFEREDRRQALRRKRSRVAFRCSTVVQCRPVAIRSPEVALSPFHPARESTEARPGASPTALRCLGATCSQAVGSTGSRGYSECLLGTSGSRETLQESVVKEDRCQRASCPVSLSSARETERPTSPCRGGSRAGCSGYVTRVSTPCSAVARHASSACAERSLFGDGHFGNRRSQEGRRDGYRGSVALEWS
jgi:hypothetical protein